MCLRLEFEMMDSSSGRTVDARVDDARKDDAQHKLDDFLVAQSLTQKQVNSIRIRGRRLLSFLDVAPQCLE